MFLRMLSYYISSHIKHALSPILFTYNYKPAAASKRAYPVSPAQRSYQALSKQRANSPKTITPCTASPACSPTCPPCAPTTFSPPTTYPHSPSSPSPPRYNSAPSTYCPLPTATASRSQYPTTKPQSTNKSDMASFAAFARPLRSATVNARKNGIHEVPDFGAAYPKPTRRKAVGESEPASRRLRSRGRK